MYVLVNVCMFALMYVCVLDCTYVPMFVHIDGGVFGCTFVCLYILMYRYIYLCVYVCLYVGGVFLITLHFCSIISPSKKLSKEKFRPRPIRVLAVRDQIKKI